VGVIPKFLFAAGLLVVAPCAAQIAVTNTSSESTHGTISIKNTAQTVKVLRVLYAPPIEGSDWADGYLGKEIPPGATGQISVDTKARCIFDVRIEFDDDSFKEYGSVNACVANQIVVK